MATYNVSGQAQLSSALSSARSGDKIMLSGGNYGTLDLNGGRSAQSNLKFGGEVTIASASSSNPAVFSNMNLTKVSNIKFDRVKFDYSSESNSSKAFVVNNTQKISFVNSEFNGMLKDGWGDGQGLWATSSSDLTVSNTKFSDFYTGLHLRAINNLKLLDNSVSGIALDAMILGRIKGALIEGNDVEMRGKAGVGHRDMIQFWNGIGGNDPSSNITIRNNELNAGEKTTHGIYMANDYARMSGDKSAFHSDILIENNTIKSGQRFGIFVAEADGLTIRNNVVLQHPAINDSRAIAIPVIGVDDDAVRVTITGNTTHKTPRPISSESNWAFSTADGWNVSNNKIVALGTNATAPVQPSEPASPHRGNGVADDFRFNGDTLSGSQSVTYDAHFPEGDRITLRNFDKGTFLDYSGGNVVMNSADKSYVRIDSLTDVQELVTASRDVSAIVRSNDLVMRIAQDNGMLDVVLKGQARDYVSSFDADLF